MSVTDDLGGGDSGPTLEQFYHFLYSKKAVEFHTEIQHPPAMTGLDVYANYLNKHQMKGAGAVLDDYRGGLRVNFVAYKRKRAEETVKVAQAQAEAEKARKDNLQFMTGLKR